MLFQNDVLCIFRQRFILDGKNAENKNEKNPTNYQVHIWFILK